MKHPWYVVIEKNEEGEVDFSVEAHTLDGALSAATIEFKDKYERLPHEEEFIKVERLAAPTDT